MKTILQENDLVIATMVAQERMSAHELSSKLSRPTHLAPYPAPRPSPLAAPHPTPHPTLKRALHAGSPLVQYNTPHQYWFSGRSSLMSFFIVLLFAIQFVLPSPGWSASDQPRFEGLEFYGSSLITRVELEKILRLKPGRSLSSVEGATSRLQSYFDKKRILANVQTIVIPPSRIYVVVDLEDRTNIIPTTNLYNPHHVRVQSEKPFILLSSLHDRLARLDEEGRSSKESYPDGVRVFSDEPARQLAREIRRFGSVLRNEWLEIVNSDPEPTRRVDAIELLNWAGSYEDSCEKLIPALDDMSYLVRVEADRFLYPRLAMLSTSFPFDKLGAALCRQLHRPSHQDRLKSMYAIKRVLRLHPELVPPMKKCAQARLKVISNTSVIPTVRKVSSDLLILFDTYRPSSPQVPKRIDAGF